MQEVHGLAPPGVQALLGLLVDHLVNDHEDDDEQSPCG